MFHSRIYLTIAITAVAGLLFVVTKDKAPMRRVSAQDEDKARSYSSSDMLETHQVYYLHVTDTSRELPKENWYWEVKHADSVYVQIYDQPDPRFTTKTPGSYLFKAYVDMREVASDTLEFREGERVEVSWPDDKAFVGKELSFSDHSLRVKERRWSIFQDEEMIPGFPISEKDLHWKADGPGEVLVRLELELESGKDSVLEKNYLVSVRPVEKIKAREEKPKEEPKRRDPKPIRPEPAPPAPQPIISGACFHPPGTSMARAVLVKAPLPEPTREAVAWSTTGTVFEVRPERDCQLASFQWWGNNFSGDGSAVATVECLETGCNGGERRIVAFNIQVDYERPEEQPISIYSSPVLRAGLRYRISIKPTKGAPMGQFQLPRTNYGADGLELTFSQPQSSVFGLTFRLK